MNNVVRVSGEQPRDSATHKHVSILLQISLPSRAPHNTEQSPLCYTILGGLWFWWKLGFSSLFSPFLSTFLLPWALPSIKGNTRCTRNPGQVGAAGGFINGGALIRLVCWGRFDVLAWVLTSKSRELEGSQGSQGVQMQGLPWGRLVCRSQ